MRLEPVYLLAPKPKPPSMPTRRAFLLAGSTFALGSVLGGACGYSIGVVKAANEPAGDPKAAGGVAGALESSGDAQLDFWRNLAVKAPLDDLFAKAPQFLAAQSIDYPKDRVLWIGVDRISEEIVKNPGRSVDYAIIQVVIQHIQRLNPPPELQLEDRIPRLQERRDQARKKG